MRAWRSDWHVPSASALCQAPRRLGELPLQRLFERVALPIAGPGAPGGWLAGWRLLAIDGVQMDVADTAENDAAFGRTFKAKLPAPYPQARVVGLGECGTHAIGGCTTGERDLTRDLLLTFEPDMLVIADRGFYSYQLWAEAAETGAQLLWRVSAPLKLPVREVYPDGSYRSVLIDTIERQRVRRARLRGQVRAPVGVAVRVIEYQVADRAGSGETVRLLTTIADPNLLSAAKLAAAYAQRWEFEISLAELELRQRGPGRVLRSHNPDTVRQEIWAIGLVHYAVRHLMARVAADHDTDPDRVSFIRSLRIIRRHATAQAAFSP